MSYPAIMRFYYVFNDLLTSKLLENNFLQPLFFGNYSLSLRRY